MANSFNLDFWWLRAIAGKKENINARASGVVHSFNIAFRPHPKGP